MPIYASPEQFMRDRSEYARKGISRGRSVVVMTFADGVLFVAENHQPSLHKVSEIYDRIGFAGVGRYNEFENLRTAGIRLADVRGFSYDRRDVTGRWLANAYAQTIGSIFSEHQKPFEVELCVAEVGPAPEPGIPLVQDESAPAGGHDQLYRISYDGSIVDERRFVVMGGATEPVVTALQNSFSPGLELRVALRAAVDALGAAGENAPRQLTPAQLEVAVLDRTLPGRTFRRLEAGVLGALLQEPEVVVTLPEGPVTDEPPAVSGSVRGDVPADDDASDGTPENGDTVR